MSKVLPKISAPGSIKMPSGSRDPNKGEHARGGALAKPGRSVPTGQSQGRMPLQNPPSNVVGGKIGQREAAPPGPGARIRPITQTPTVGNPVATKKPNRRGGAAFYGET